MTDDQATDDANAPDDALEASDTTEPDGTTGDDDPTGFDETVPTADTESDTDGPMDEASGQARESEVTYDPTEAPLADLAASVTDRESASSTETETETDADRLFDQHSVSEIDSDRLWERLEEDDTSGTPLLEEDRDEREIDAHRYCKQCEHFSAPPDVGCGLEGTEILELASLGTFRVVDCPVVLEDEALEREY